MSFDKDASEMQVVNDMREHGGVISSGPMARTRLLVLTTTGAKTGERRRATIADGAERDRLWQQHLELQPQLAAHAEQAGRTIPMVRLTPR